ncbi:MAG: outer membrane beta-barrel protein [Terracidiphilus sp.]
MMRVHAASVLAVAMAVSGAAARAQSAPGIGSLGKNDIGLSLYGAFTPTSTDSYGDTQSPSNAAGGMIEVRHLAGPILGFEGTYSFNRADQTYNELPLCPAGACQAATTVVKANANELSFDWVPSVHLASVRPFGVLGVGVLLNVPSSGQSNTQTATKPVYVYGAGLDWGMLPHLGLRLQYRGNLYSAPDVTTLYTSIGKFTQTAEPMIGVYFRL